MQTNCLCKSGFISIKTLVYKHFYAIIYRFHIAQLY